MRNFFKGYKTEILHKKMREKLQKNELFWSKIEDIQCLIIS